MEVLKISLVGGEKNCLKYGDEQGGYQVYMIIYCISPDTLVELYLLAILKIACKSPLK